MHTRGCVYKKNGELLLEKNLITEGQLNIALQEQRLKGGHLNQHLIRLGFVKDFDIAMCLASQFGFPFMPLENYGISEDVLRLIPLQFVLAYCLIPIDKTKGLITIAAADPPEEEVISILRLVTHCDINIVISTCREVRDAIAKYYKVSATDFDLDRFESDLTLLDGEKTINNFSYNGINRRRYRRLNKNLDAGCLAYPGAAKTKIKNISMSGILFESESHYPQGTRLGLIIYLDKGVDILVSIEVVRSEVKGSAGVISGQDPTFLFSVAGFFNFVPQEDQNLLAEFLRANLIQNKDSLS